MIKRTDIITTLDNLLGVVEMLESQDLSREASQALRIAYGNLADVKRLAVTGRFYAKKGTDNR